MPDVQGHPGEACRTPSGREASRTHEARLRPGRHELISGEPVRQELKRRGATLASVPFSCRAGRRGRTDRIVLSRADGDEFVQVEAWTSRDELSYALEAPGCRSS